MSGPLPTKTLERLVALGDVVRWVAGNADREVVRAHDRGATHQDALNATDPSKQAAAWAAAHLDFSARDVLAALPPAAVIELDGLGRARFCHGSPRSDEEILTPSTSPERLQQALAGVSEPVVICGHTHRQFDRSAPGGARVINAGSVGLPYEGAPGAYWALLGPDVDLRSRTYDHEAAVEQFVAAGYPDASEFARESLVDPIDPNEATAFFERLATEQRRSGPGGT